MLVCVCRRVRARVVMDYLVEEWDGAAISVSLRRTRLYILHASRRPLARRYSRHASPTTSAAVNHGLRSPTVSRRPN